jgi:hypothetical protein
MKPSQKKAGVNYINFRQLLQNKKIFLGQRRTLQNDKMLILQEAMKILKAYIPNNSTS